MYMTFSIPNDPSLSLYIRISIEQIVTFYPLFCIKPDVRMQKDTRYLLNYLSYPKTNWVTKQFQQGSWHIYHLFKIGHEMFMIINMGTVTEQ